MSDFRPSEALRGAFWDAVDALASDDVTPTDYADALTAIADQLVVERLQHAASEGPYVVGVPGTEWPKGHFTQSYYVVRRDVPTLATFCFDKAEATLVCGALNLAAKLATEGTA